MTDQVSLKVIRRDDTVVTNDIPTTTKTADYTINDGDIGKDITFDSASTLICNLPTAAAAMNGFQVFVRNAGAGAVTIDPSGSETIDNDDLVILLEGQWCWLRSDGTTFRKILFGPDRFQYMEPVKKTVDYTVDISDAGRLLMADSAGATVTFTLPALADTTNVRNVFAFKNINAGKLNIQGFEDEIIDGEMGLSLARYNSVILVADKACDEWRLLSVAGEVPGITAPASIDQSLLFDGGSDLRRTPSVSSNQKTWTYSGWLKLGNPGTKMAAFEAFVSTTNNTRIVFGTSQITVDSTSGGSAQVNLSGYPPLLRDPTAWFHLVVACDTTQATSANRAHVYINGVKLGEPLAVATYPALNADLSINGTVSHAVGLNRANGGTDQWDGYMAQVAFVDGLQLDPTSFGEFDANGNWAAKDISDLTFGTNGFLLDFADAADLGKDISGNGNDFTPSGFATNDQVADSPINKADGSVGNWCTLNPIDENHNATAPNFKDGNLIFENTSTGNNSHTRGTISVNTGKWYWEATIDTVRTHSPSIGVASEKFNNAIGNINPETYLYLRNGNKQHNTTITSYGQTTSNGDVIGVAFDAGAGTLEFFHNGTSQGQAFSGLDTTLSWAPFVNSGDISNQATLNFGQRSFVHTVPSGFKSLNSKTWADVHNPPITKPSDHFVTVIDTEANIAGTLSAARSGWTDYVDILKNRDTSETWAWQFSHDSSNEYAVSTTATHQAKRSLAGTDDWVGYSIRVDSTSNVRAGSVSHTNGADTAVAYTTVGTARCMVFLFPRSNGEVPVFHPDLTSGKLLNLTGTEAETTDSAIKSVTATGFSIDTGEATGTYDYLVVPEVVGFCDLAKYTGNGAADGPVVYLGFRPELIINKRGNAAGDSWIVEDSARDPFNDSSKWMGLDSASAESSFTAQEKDKLSTGFKIRASGAASNTSGGSYYVLAFAEQPFGNKDLPSGQSRAV